jgi:hypothetical protein
VLVSSLALPVLSQLEDLPLCFSASLLLVSMTAQR